MKILLVSLLSLFALGTTGLTSAVTAQENEEKPVTAADVDVAIEIPRPENLLEIEEGTLICSTAQGYQICDESHSQDLFGVVSARPALSIESNDIEDGLLVIKRGEVLVKVSNAAGEIVQGDYITSSENPEWVKKLLKMGMSLEQHYRIQTQLIQNQLE